MKSYENLKETLAFYGVNCNEPYYISSGNSILKFPKKSFRIDFYAFCICLAGNIELEIDNNTYNINQNGFLISAPSTIIKFKKVSKDFRMKLLFFSKDFLLKNIANPFIIDKMNLFRYGSYNILEADIQQAVPLYAFLDYLQIKTSVKGKFTEEIIRTIIFNLLLEIAEIVSLEGGDSKENKKKKKELFLKFDELVKENILLYKRCRFLCKTAVHI